MGRDTCLDEDKRNRVGRVLLMGALKEPRGNNLAAYCRWQLSCYLREDAQPYQSKATITDNDVVHPVEAAEQAVPVLHDITF
ncbi:hypothetical protein Tco_1179711 [Tanacetum coccineum]